MIGVCVAGARGRMGQALSDLLRADPDLKLVSALERPGHPELGLTLFQNVKLTDDARAAIGAAEVLLDFSTPVAALQHLELAAALGKPVVTGTTGFSKEQQTVLQALGGRVAVVWSANVSRGVHVLKALVRRAAAALPEYDAEVVEIHHRGKADAPSGTALQLSEEIRAARGNGRAVFGRRDRRESGEIGMAAVRGGDVVGEHQVLFLGAGEQFQLIHRASSREHFCRGALAAVRFVHGKPPGLYGMTDVFGGE